MSTSNRVHWLQPAVLGWLVAMGCLAAGLVLIAANPLYGRGWDIPTSLVLAISSSAVGAFILVRRPGHGIGRVCLAAGILVSLGMLGNGLSVALAYMPGVPARLYWLVLSLATLVPVLGFVLIGPVLLGMYPTGTFTPTGRRVAWLAIGISLPMFLISVIGSRLITYGDMSALNPLWLPGVPPELLGVPAAVLIVTYVVAIALASASLVSRYRTADQLQRLQIRWVALNGMAIVAFLLLIVVNPAGIGDQAWSGWLIMAALLPATVGIAILRYRLYDIDRIVSNAIGYGVVTVVLFAVFALVNLVLVSQVSPLVNNEGVAVAASTLLVAAMFNPLRTRVQRAVDRRFHRARYDAERLVADFSGRLRDELDLPTLATELAATSGMAVEPSSAHVWLREPSR